MHDYARNNGAGLYKEWREKKQHSWFGQPTHEHLWRSDVALLGCFVGRYLQHFSN